MKHKRKPLVIVLICLAAAAAVAAGVWFFWLRDYLSAANASPVYVNSVASIVGLDTGANPRYSGVVDPQKTTRVEKDESRTVSEVLVKVGDEVHVGDVLFRYDTQEQEFSLTEAQIALQGIANQISTQKTQLESLKSAKAKAGKDEQYSYTVQIQSKELEIEQLEYQSTLKQNEIDKIQLSLQNTDVLSEADGVVKEINTTPKTDSSGQPAAFISILSSGEYRIKGTVSELNRDSISVGQAVVVHSRVNSEQTWHGTVDSIDMEPSTDQNNNYFFGMESGEKSSKYNFYVLLDSLDGLILGQHVYIEPDTGTASKKEGLWLPAVYVAHDESGSFVWAKSEKETLEKRTITLGEYDTDNDSYEIKGGVTTADFIAYPNDELKPGMPTTSDAAAALPTVDGNMDGSVDGNMNGGMMNGDGSLDNGFADDGAVNTLPQDGMPADDVPEGSVDVIGGADGGAALYNSYDGAAASSAEGVAE